MVHAECLTNSSGASQDLKRAERELSSKALEVDDLQRRTDEVAEELSRAGERSALANQAAERAAAANQELSQQLSQALVDLTACKVSTQLPRRKQRPSILYLCIALLLMLWTIAHSAAYEAGKSLAVAFSLRLSHEGSKPSSMHLAIA